MIPVDRMQQAPKPRNLEAIESFVVKNPQMVEGRLQYVVSGSTSVLLFIEASDIKTHTVDEDGNVTALSDIDVYEKTKEFLKENLSKFGASADIDISFTENNAPQETIADDQFVLRPGEKILSGIIAGKEYYFESPVDYVVKLLAHKYSGFGGHAMPHQKYARLKRLETILEAVLKDVSEDSLYDEIERRLESPDMQIGGIALDRQKEIVSHFLSEPHEMYASLTKTILKTPEGDADASININEFPKVKGIIDELSNRHSDHK